MVYDKSLRLHLLPSELIVKGFVKGEEQCNYEYYLLELVNQSSFFISLSHGQRYSAPESEAHGECDCISDAYQLDFKLIGGNTRYKPEVYYQIRNIFLQKVCWRHVLRKRRIAQYRQRLSMRH